jgi:hypothetical protein
LALAVDVRSHPFATTCPAAITTTTNASAGASACARVRAQARVNRLPHCLHLLRTHLGCELLRGDLGAS